MVKYIYSFVTYDVYKYKKQKKRNNQQQQEKEKINKQTNKIETIYGIMIQKRISIFRENIGER